MRLLTRTATGEYVLTKEYLPDDPIPAYAILSHTWSAEEVTFQEWTNGTGKDKRGYDKIKFFGDQASKDGFQYFWVDTVCIDKTNSVELQEAISSMYRWYQQAARCDVYLSDVSTNESNGVDASSQHWEPAFRHSRWFTRGWTLQELIAPKDVRFYDRDWHALGSKNELRGIISEITKICPKVLAGQDLKRCSIAQRMSWAAARDTTRPEDRAYSLLGIFDINMPLLYGEGGEKAFCRLQEEIMKRSDDHSIFAWKMPARYAVHGLLAPSPAAFKDSQDIISCYAPRRKLSIARRRRTPYSSTNQGLQINLSLAEHLRNGLYGATLNCMDQRTGAQLGIYLKQVGENRFVRTQLDQLPKLGLDRWGRGFKSFEHRTIYIPHAPLTSYRPQRRFRSRPRLDPHAARRYSPCPYIKNAKAITATFSMCKARCGKG